MTEWALHPVPASRGVLREQIRAVGGSLRIPAMGAAALLVLATAFAANGIFRYGATVGFHPERWLLPGLAGLLFPVGVWFGEDRYGGGFLWTVPVDRRRHALAKVFAGWAWLMAAIGIFVLWLLLLALVSGGNVVGVETLKMIPAYPLPGPQPLDPATIRPLQWRPEPLLWLGPFTAATGTYLLASAVALGARYPARWIVGGVLGFILVTVATDMTDAEGLAAAPSRTLEWLLMGPVGLETFLIANTETLKVETSLTTTGESVAVWRGLPDVPQWALTTLIWLAAGLAAIWAAASRHRERRSG
jgi:hypothetical protein